ncbi:MAG: phospholipase D-like domain-containing protein [Cellulomonas sp.]|nr:phospholipase D-like domain-containing protein [Cellulomonas sp.]MCR6647271.1 phospholipase D-like domain-containing protein [Cellulomonas sp.]
MTDTVLTAAHDSLLELTADSPGDVRLASPFVSLPVATTLAARAASSPVSWSLLTNLDPVAIANGYLSPNGLRRLLDAGVAVRSHPSLHAKVYLAGSRGMTGSGNLTHAGLGVGSKPNLELSVMLAQDQVKAAEVAFDGWWNASVVVNEATLGDAEAHARKVPTVVPPSPPPGRANVAQVAAELLAEARHVNLWAKAVYGDAEANWEGDDLWIASSKRGRPTFAPGDLVLIYAKDLHVCDAIVEITAEAIWAPDIIAEDRPQEDADRWPWLNWVRGRLWVASIDGIAPADLGFTPQGLQGGHRRLDLAEFAAAVRHFAGDSVQ